MCLQIRKREIPKIAEYDIPCIKLISYNGSNYRGLYYGNGPISPWIINGVDDYCASHQCYSANKLRNPYGEPLECDEIGIGYIHTFGSDCVPPYIHSNVKFFECIIPAGTEYFEGTFRSLKSFASRKIRFVRQTTYKELDEKSSLNK